MAKVKLRFIRTRSEQLRILKAYPTAGNMGIKKSDLFLWTGIVSDIKKMVRG